MILAAHQPQYLAWPGYYHKMIRADVFVYLDQVQFKKREFQSRNRVKSPQGELWLSVPVVTKGRYAQKIRDVEVDPTQKWGEEHWKSLLLNYRGAPHFGEHEAFFGELYGRPWSHLMPLCLELDGYLRRQFAIEAPIRLESEVGSTGVSTERLVSLCRKLGADAYLSGSGGRDYLDEEAFANAGIKLSYQEFRPPRYSQRFGEFLPNLAAVDLLFNCGAKESAAILRGVH